MRSPHLEPYSARNLAEFLAKRGFHLLSQSGSHCTWANKDGVTVGIPDPAGGRHPVPTILAEKVAARLGMSLRDLRKALGHSEHGGHKGAKQGSRFAKNDLGPNRHKQIDALAARVDNALRDLDLSTAPSHKFSALYGAMLSAARSVEQAAKEIAS